MAKNNVVTLKMEVVVNGEYTNLRLPRSVEHDGKVYSVGTIPTKGSVVMVGDSWVPMLSFREQKDQAPPKSETKTFPGKSEPESGKVEALEKKLDALIDTLTPLLAKAK